MCVTKIRVSISCVFELDNESVDLEECWVYFSFQVSVCAKKAKLFEWWHRDGATHTM